MMLGADDPYEAAAQWVRDHQWADAFDVAEGLGISLLESGEICERLIRQQRLESLSGVRRMPVRLSRRTAEGEPSGPG
jgi:hypothetical protein